MALQQRLPDGLTLDEQITPETCGRRQILIDDKGDAARFPADDGSGYVFFLRVAEGEHHQPCEK